MSFKGNFKRRIDVYWIILVFIAGVVSGCLFVVGLLTIGSQWP